MVDIRSLAEGQECQVRIPEICTSDPMTTKHKHIRRAGLAGVNQSPPDLCGVWTCPTCHEIISGKVLFLGAQYKISLYLLDGMLKTLELTDKEIEIGVRNDHNGRIPGGATSPA